MKYYNNRRQLRQDNDDAKKNDFNIIISIYFFVSCFYLCLICGSFRSREDFFFKILKILNILPPKNKVYFFFDYEENN